MIPLLRAGRHPGASVHAPSRRLRQSRGRSASGDPGGARSRPEGRRRSRQPLLLSAGARRRSMPASFPTRSARTFTATTPTCPRPPARPDQHEDDENHPFAGQAQVQPGPGDELDDGARPHARAGRADGHVQPGQDARPCRRNRRAQSGHGGRRLGDRTNEPDALSFATTRTTKSSPSVCCSPRSACAPVRDTTLWRQFCRRPLRRREVSVSSIEENATVRNEREFPSAGGRARDKASARGCRERKTIG